MSAAFVLCRASVAVGYLSLGTRLFKLAVFASAATCTVLLATSAIALMRGSYLPFLSITSGFHLTVFPQGGRTHLLLCNDTQYGPYCGRITVSIAGQPNPPTITGFDNLPGVYYQHIAFPDRTTWWGLRLHVGYPIVLTMVLPLAWWVSQWRRHVGGRGFPVGGAGAGVVQGQGERTVQGPFIASGAFAGGVGVRYLTADRPGISQLTQRAWSGSRRGVRVTI
jgi:hypothetical protein